MIKHLLTVPALIALFTILLPSHSLSQQVFERKAVEVSNLGISFTNVGTIGRPNVRTVPIGPPSMEFPRGSGVEHLFEAGIWMGALVGGDIRVSTSSITTSGGYSQGAPGFEVTNDGDVFFERSSLEDNPNFSPEAISHQDLVTRFTDRNTTIGNQVISGHVPMNADIRFESYNWNFGFTEGLTILRYDITNNGTDPWIDFYFGMYSDLVTRNINAPNVETGSAFFNKGGIGWIDSLHAMYVFDRGSFDRPRLNTHAAGVFLGAEYRGVEFHPRAAEEVAAAGLPVPSVRPSFWLFGAGAGDFIRPADDLDRYNRMASAWPLDVHRQSLRNDGLSANGNFIQLNTIGPFPEVRPRETITIYFSFVAALMPPEFQGLVPGDVTDVNQLDNLDSRANLTESIGWAYRLYDGTVDEQGNRTRFLVPEPPLTPRMRIELDAGVASIYWDNRAEFSVDPVTGLEDFAGYRLYRTQLGDDLRGTISSSALMLREWDVPGKNVGFNTGFDEIRLDTPVRFPGDPTDYYYRFDVPNLLSGWQYLFSVTAFDEGDDRTPPLETSIVANAIRVFPGTAPNENFGSDAAEFQVGVYPNPYRVGAAWDGAGPFSRKIVFYNLPRRAQVRVYTLAGERVATLDHDADTYTGDIRWFRDLSVANRMMPGGEHAWDLLSDANQNLTTGLYLYTVQDVESGNVQRGRFAIIK
jgi:hypothetical protein